MEKPLTAKGRARRQAMVDTALTLFLRQGYDGTTLDQIIAEAGGSRRMLYGCFGDKAGLFRAVIEDATAAMVGEVEIEALLAMAPEDALQRVAHTWLDMVVNPRSISVYRLLVSEAQRFPEPAEAFYRAGPMRLRQVLAEYLRHQHAYGKLQVPDPEQAARLFFGLIRGDYKMRALLCPRESLTAQEREADVRAAVALFLRGTRPTPAAD